MLLDKREIDILKHYLPQQSIKIVGNWLTSYDVHFVITKERKTVLGSFRPKQRNKPNKITVNHNLSPNHFLMVVIHEMAHLMTYEKYGRRVRPHGKEWKHKFSELMKESLTEKLFHSDLNAVIYKMIEQPPSSCSGDLLFRKAIRDIEDVEDSQIFLEELLIGNQFRFKSKLYRILEKKRTRFLCEELPSKRKFLIHQGAEIEIVETSV